MAKKRKSADPTPKEKEGGVAPSVQEWLDEIDACRKREKTFRKDGHKVRALYCNDTNSWSDGVADKTSQPFAIIFSNTETIGPALYSQVPRPVVRARYRNVDPMAPYAARAGQTLLEFLLDTNIEGYDTYDETLQCVTWDALLPGRGISTLKYDAEIEEKDDGEDDKGQKKTAAYKKSGTELVCPEIISWDRFYQGYARKWSKVPWVAYEFHLDKDEATSLFGAEKAAKIKYTKGEDRETEGYEAGEQRNTDERYTGNKETALVYQIWDKDGGRKIRYISPQYTEGPLKVQDDELELTGFYNCPKPLQFIYKTDDLVPTAPYALYEQQAKELNELTRRITSITRAIKARGVYDKELGDDIQKIMDADDNELMGADKGSSLAAEKGLGNAIWFMPLDVLITTLRELVAAREQCKQVIYEITGISDILRGASKASETLGAQQIKNQWGSLRIKNKQQEVQRYACDMLRITIEIAAKKFSQETWAQMTGLPYLTDEQVAQAQKAQEAAQQATQEAQQGIQSAQQALQALGPQDPNAPPQGPVPGATPPPQAAQQGEGDQLTLDSGPQQIAEKVRQKAAIATKAITLQQQQAIQANQEKAQQAANQMQQAQAALQQPTWKAVLATLNNNIQRAFDIDIETNSTIEPEATEDQKSITELLQALSQTMQGLSPLVAQGILPFQMAQAMLMAIVKRFRFGDEIEEFIAQMQPPQPQQQEGKHQADLAKAQADAASQKAQSDAQHTKMQGQVTDLQTKLEAKERESQLQQREADLAIREKDLKSKHETFALEQKHAVDNIAKNVTVENVKAESKRQVAEARAESAAAKRAMKEQAARHSAELNAAKAASAAKANGSGAEA